MSRSSEFCQCAFTCAVLLCAILFCAVKSADAQSGLRESLERLDRNQNGEIEPDEITPLARPYLERIAEVRRMDLNRDYSIERYQEAARIYHAFQNGIRGNRVRIDDEKLIRSFGPDDEDELIPDFGSAIIKFPYTQEDLEEAERTLRRYDRDEDGTIDRREARRGDWTHRDPFEMDLNNDGRLNKTEFAQRYARRRLMSGDSSELIQKSRRTGNGIQPFERSRDERESSSSWWRSGGNSYWLTASMMGRFDANRNGRLESEETTKLGLPIGQIDIDRDGEITRDELFGYVGEVQSEAGDATLPLPGWFFELDLDRDGQVAMSEFTKDWTDAKLAEFASLDLNTDGLLTSAEVAKSSAMIGGTFSNTTAEILPPRKTVISEIEVDEDVMIGDLNLRISITHTNTSYLDGYLTGPDGERIELFTGVGGSGDHFSETVFDDQASTPIVKGRPPFEGSFQSSAAAKRQTSLSHYTGKSARGVWQLVIRGTRSERFGMLHSWSLQIRSSDQLIDAALASEPVDSQSAAVSTTAAQPTASYAPTRSPDAAQDKEQRKRDWYAAQAREKEKQRYSKEGGEKEKRFYEKPDRKQLRDKEKSIDWSKLTPEQTARYKAYFESQRQKQSKK